MGGQAWTYADEGVELCGELYRPSGTPNGGAVLVVHEADGIGGNVREHCARLADLGYIAAAADMHGGGRVLEGDAMYAALSAFRSDPSYHRRRVRAGLDAMCRLNGVDPTRTAAMGFCFGGMTVLELARSGASVAAVASFHGLLTTGAAAEPGVVRARILAATGALDPLVPPEDVEAFQREMRAAEADWHLLVHGRAYHSYTNHAVGTLGDPRMAYDRLSHRLSWAALVDFLDDALLSRG